jgi:hypothetical protein
LKVENATDFEKMIFENRKRPGFKKKYLKVKNFPNFVKKSKRPLFFDFLPWVTKRKFLLFV